MTPTRGRVSWVALLVLAAGWGGAAMFGWPPAPAHAQSGIDFTVEVASTTATVTANTGVPNELVSLKLWYRDERDRIIECGDSGADVDVELTTDAQGVATYVSTDPAVTETYGATGCLTLRGIEHWASSEPLFSISPPFSEIALRVGLPTQPITINYRGDASNRYTLEAAQGATITVADSTYAAGRAYAFRESGEPLAAGSITMTLTPSKTSNVGFTVRRDAAPFRGHALTVSRHIPAGTPAPTPTVWPEYASEVDLRVEGGPGQIVATFEMCCHRTYLLELRDIRTQAKLLQWSYVSTANGQQYIAPPAVFGNLDAGTEYGICLYVVDRLTGSPGSRSAYSGNYLCSTATTNFPTPTPPVPTPTTRVELEATVTPTPLPAAVPANLFRTPTPVGGVVRTPTPAPTAQPPPLPTPTPWGETLFYTNTVPNWETAPQVAETADGKVEIRVQWTGVAEADYYELLITDGSTVGRTEETNGAVERTHSWRAPASSDASRVRVRAVQKGSAIFRHRLQRGQQPRGDPLRTVGVQPIQRRTTDFDQYHEHGAGICANQTWRRDGECRPAPRRATGGIRVLDRRAVGNGGALDRLGIRAGFMAVGLCGGYGSGDRRRREGDRGGSGTVAVRGWRVLLFRDVVRPGRRDGGTGVARAVFAAGAGRIHGLHLGARARLGRMNKRAR